MGQLFQSQMNPGTLVTPSIKEKSLPLIMSNFVDLNNQSHASSYNPKKVYFFS